MGLVLRSMPVPKNGMAQPYTLDNTPLLSDVFNPKPQTLNPISNTPYLPTPGNPKLRNSIMVNNNSNTT